MISLRLNSFRPFPWLILFVTLSFALAPWWTDNVTLRENLILAALDITLASNLNLMLGYAGYVNFGNIVMFGLGGYFGVYLVSVWHWPLLGATLVGAIAVSIIAYMFGIGILRLRGAYFALATIGVNEAVSVFVTNFEPWGGATGLYLSLDAYAPLGGPGRALWIIYFLMVAVMGLSLALSYVIRHSKFGLGLLAIGENEDAAATLGVPTRTYKAMVYSVSAFLPAIAGGLFFFKSGIIEPTERLRPHHLDRSDRYGDARRARHSGGTCHRRISLRGIARLFAHRAGIFAFPAGDRRAAAAGDCVVRPRWTDRLHSPESSLHPKVAGMTALLEVTDLSKRFGGVEAVGDLNFDLSAGELLGLIGPNGAGKSTVFNLINGVTTPDSGRIKFDGADITGKAPNIVARHGIARAHQIVQPLAGLSVLENCTVGACFGRENLPIAKAREIAREVVATVGLAERMDTLAGSLTTAGKKRLELARALSARPRLLLLDEVLAGLNPTEVEAMIEIVQDIRRAGVAILMIEHVMRAIMRLSDRIVVLDLGRKLAEGRPEEVANDPEGHRGLSRQL